VAQQEEVVEFPEYLDDEDMDLAIKEWTLTGCRMLGGEDPNTGARYLDVYGPDDRSSRSQMGAYVQRSDGGWVDVSLARALTWTLALECAENYDVVQQTK
jgi:hypothetical protein